MSLKFTVLLFVKRPSGLEIWERPSTFPGEPQQGDSVLLWPDAQGERSPGLGIRSRTWTFDGVLELALYPVVADGTIVHAEKLRPDAPTELLPVSGYGDLEAKLVTTGWTLRRKA